MKIQRMLRRGKASQEGSGSWCSHAQTAHSPRKPRAGTPSRAETPSPFPLPKEVWNGGPARRVVPARGGGGVKKRGDIASQVPPTTSPRALHDK